MTQINDRVSALPAGGIQVHSEISRGDGISLETYQSEEEVEYSPAVNPQVAKNNLQKPGPASGGRKTLQRHL